MGIIETIGEWWEKFRVAIGSLPKPTVTGQEAARLVNEGIMTAEEVAAKYGRTIEWVRAQASSSRYANTYMEARNLADSNPGLLDRARSTANGIRDWFQQWLRRPGGPRGRPMGPRDGGIRIPNLSTLLRRVAHGIGRIGSGFMHLLRKVGNAIGMVFGAAAWLARGALSVIGAVISWIASVTGTAIAIGLLAAMFFGFFTVECQYRTLIGTNYFDCFCVATSSYVPDGIVGIVENAYCSFQRSRF